MLEAYRSYEDRHLSEYWTDENKWKRLVRNGVITRNGTPIDDITFRANELKDWKQRVANHTELQRLKMRKREIDRTKDTVIRQKIDEIEKLNNVLRVKSGQSPRSRANSKHVGPFALPKAQAKASGRPRDRVGWQPARRTSSAPLDEPTEVIIVREKESSFATSDARSSPPGSAALSRGRSRASSSLKTPPGYHVVALDGKDAAEGSRARAGRTLPLIDNSDDLSITELERRAGLKLAEDKKRYYPWVYLDSPYLESQMPYEVKAWAMARQRSGSAKGRFKRSASAHAKIRNETSMSVKKNQQEQVTSGPVVEHYRRVTVAAENMEGESDNWEQMEVKMRYHGDLFQVQRDDKPPFDEIIVEQQHCGGNTVNVFRGNVVPGEEFSFVSHRHPGFPFSLNLYVNGKKDSRVSTCCEYKHTRGLRLGSKSGQFSITDIVGGGPCRKCLQRVARRKPKNRTVNYSAQQTKVKDTNDHDFYSLIIPIEADEAEYRIQGATMINDDDSDDNDDDSASDDDARRAHSPNTHDYYDLKVSLEDDDYEYRPPRGNSIQPITASGGQKSRDK